MYMLFRPHPTFFSLKSRSRQVSTVTDLIQEYGIVSFEEVKRFRTLELKWRMGAFHVKPSLLRLTEELRDRMLPAFADWLMNSNTMREGGQLDAEIDAPLVVIYDLLNSAQTLDELIVAVDQTLHAQHRRGIFISEISKVNSFEKFDQITDRDRFRQPVVIVLSELWIDS